MTRLPRSSGILLHLTALPGPHGSGDLGPAAYHFVDWLAAAGQSLWQMLPIGGIGPGNSPYMSSSAFAGNPLLIDLTNLRACGWLTDADIEGSADLLEARIDYAAVYPFRMQRLQTAATRFLGDAGAPERAAFDEFCAGESGWLDDYALFMALATHHDWRDWTTWEPGLASREAAALDAAAVRFAAQTDFWKFCQWCFFRQWFALKAYANGRGIRLIGDIPIFVAHQSADVWARRDLFELDASGMPSVVAGVPPDYFSETGQRWGNPLYRWSAHEAEDFAWWVARLRWTTALVDLVRIDHFRGFAAHWEIPAGEATAINGRWVDVPGEKLFAAIRHALGSLPIIAEDLGVITPDVVALRDKFRLPGMRVLHFAFGGDASHPFLPQNYPHRTVVYTGTHDNDTTRGWWRTLSGRERAFAAAWLDSDGNEIHWDLIHAASASVADTVVLPLQDVLGLDSDSRMNLPGKSSGYWEWRFRWAEIEPGHAERLARMAAAHGRCPVDRAKFTD
jgi:4-alpha-glucanotransferase